MINLSSLETFILISSIIGALFTTWRVIRIVRRASNKVAEVFEAIVKLFQLMQAEYNRNGGHSHKDLLYQIISKQDALIINQSEQIEVSRQLLDCFLEERNAKADS